MDQETVNYIINYYRDLMTEEERLAFTYQMYAHKAAAAPEKIRLLKEKGWMRETEETRRLLAKGQEVFEFNVAQRILQESPGKVFLNNCPKCHKLARTPQAKQCRHCSYSWHYNRIESLSDYNQEIDYEYLNYKIDTVWLDEKLEELYPGNRYAGLIPTLVSWMMRKDQEELVWRRILPDLNETTICPILMCPDDNDFSCTLIVAEIEHCGSYIKWHRLGLDKTKAWEAEKVGSKVEWLEHPHALTFPISDYVKMLDNFIERIAADRQEQ